MPARADVRRTVLGFSLVAFAAVGATTCAYVVARSVERESIRVADEVTDRSYAAERLSGTLSEAISSVYAYVLRPDPALLEDLGHSRAVFREQLQRLQRHTSNEEEARLLTKPLYRQYIAEDLAEGIRGYAKSVAGDPEAAAGEKGKADP